MMTAHPHTLPTCAALAEELRAVGARVEQLAMVIVSDERFLRDYVDHLQSFDFIVQHTDECANLLERIAQGLDLVEALERVRLTEMQRRLQTNIAGA